MTVVMVPRGRGNWKRVTLQIDSPADLFPSMREAVVLPGTEWFIADRWWRLLEVLP